ncbi:MAG TPA: PxKF domain-containing protein, partial [Acidimicrobiales bacterium]
VADTQYYVRDAVIEYVQHQTAPIAPAIEGRLLFAAPPAPVVSTPVVVPEPSLEGHAVVVTAAFADPAPQHGPFTCTVNFGDGAAVVPGTVSGMTCTSPAHTYATYGSYTVTVTVRDAIGSPGTASTTHVVYFDYSGPFPPLSARTNDVQAGSMIPVRFSLNGYKGMDIFMPGYPKVMACSGGAGVTVTGALHYDAYTDTYQFMWKTPKSLKGCQHLSLGLKDGSTHMIEVSFRS